MTTWTINRENSERENLYFSAINRLKKSASLKDIIAALLELEEASDLGLLSATSTLNEISLSLSDIAKHRPFFPNGSCD